MVNLKVKYENSWGGNSLIFKTYFFKGDCDYFRIRDVQTGIIIANVSESLQHSFFSAVADHEQKILWVFGSAHARRNKLIPNKCDVKPTNGCYVGVWKASFHDLTSWTKTEQALVLPFGYSLFNQDVTLVRKQMSGIFFFFSSSFFFLPKAVGLSESWLKEGYLIFFPLLCEFLSNFSAYTLLLGGFFFKKFWFTL